LALRARGDALFGRGDIVSARLFYERAAEGGDGQAALQLGETYDPDFLKRAGITGIRGDSAAARRWYQRAAGLGASEAQILLNGAANR
jgi:TPR repeat protein